MTKFNAADMNTKRFRIGRFLYYQHCKRFLFWANDLYISIWSLRIQVCWNRTFVWSDKSFRRWTLSIFWYNHKRYKSIFRTTEYNKYKRNTQHPDRYQAETEMEDYYNYP